MACNAPSFLAHLNVTAARPLSALEITKLSAAVIKALKFPSSEKNAASRRR